MSLTLFCSSSSVISIAVQCSSSRGRGFEPPSVTQGWSCNHRDAPESQLQINNGNLDLPLFICILNIDLNFWDGDSRFRVFIQHPFNELLQLVADRRPEREVEFIRLLKKGVWKERKKYFSLCLTQQTYQKLFYFLLSILLIPTKAIELDLSLLASRLTELVAH